MKLRLPQALLTAIITVGTAALPLATTVATGSLVASLISPAMAESKTYTATATANPDQNPGSFKLNGSGTGVNSLDVATIVGSGDTLTVSGSATGTQSIASVSTNGGYGGRITLTASGDGAPALTKLILDKGVEASMSGVEGKTFNVEFNNASFFTSNGATIRFNMDIKEGGVRFNGGSGQNYTFAGTISGGGDIYVCTDKAGSDTCYIKVTGDTHDFTGTFTQTSNVTSENVRWWIFGDGTNACPNDTVGGNVGASSALRAKAEYNYTGNYTVAGALYTTDLKVSKGDATFMGGATTLENRGVHTNNFVLTNGATATFSGNADSEIEGGFTVGAASTLTVEDGSKLSVGGLVTLSAGTELRQALTNAGTMELNGGLATNAFTSITNTGSLTIAGDAAFDSGFSLVNAGGTFNFNGSQHGTINLSGAGGTIVYGTDTLIDLTTLDVVAGAAAPTFRVFNEISGAGSWDYSKLKASNVLYGSEYRGMAAQYNDDGTISLVRAVLTWNPAENEWRENTNFVNLYGQNETVQDYHTVIFAVSDDVTVMDDVAMNGIEVKPGVNLKLSSTGATLGTNLLALGDGSSLDVSGMRQSDGSSTASLTQAVLGEGSTLIVSDADHALAGAEASYNLSGTGTLQMAVASSSLPALTITGDSFSGTVDITGGQIDAGRSSFAGATLKFSGQGGADFDSSTTVSHTFLFAGDAPITVNSGVTATIDSALNHEGAGGFTKQGGGTLKLTNANIDLHHINVAAGTVWIGEDNANTRSISLDSVTLSGGILEMASGRHTSSYTVPTLSIASLSVADNAKLMTHTDAQYWAISNLEFTAAGKTLTVDCNSQTENWSRFAFGGSGVGDTEGTLSVIHTITGGGNNGRGFAIQIVSDDALKNAVVNLASHSSTAASARLALHVATENASIKGLKSTLGAKAMLMSTAATTYTTALQNTKADGTLRTLTITGDSTYSFNGEVGANLNFVMTGSGSQAFSGNVTAVNGDISVSGTGTLSFTNALSNIKAVSVSNGTLTVTGGMSAQSLTLTGGSVGGGALTVGDLSMSGGTISNSALTINGTLTLTGTSVISGVGAITFGSGATIDLRNMTAGANNVYTIFTGATTATGFTDTLTWVSNGLGWEATFAVSDGTGTITLSRADASLSYTGGTSETPATLTWGAGTEFTNGAGHQATASNTSLLSFEGYTNATLDGNVAVGTLDVGANAGLTIAGSGQFSAGTIDIDKGGKLDLSGVATPSYTTADVHEGGTLKGVLADGANVNLTGDFEITGRGASGTGTVTFNGGTLVFGAVVDNLAAKLITGTDNIKLDIKSYNISLEGATDATFGSTPTPGPVIEVFSSAAAGQQGTLFLKYGSTSSNLQKLIIHGGTVRAKYGTVFKAGSNSTLTTSIVLKGGALHLETPGDNGANNASKGGLYALTNRYAYLFTNTISVELEDGATAAITSDNNKGTSAAVGFGVTARDVLTYTGTTGGTFTIGSDITAWGTSGVADRVFTIADSTRSTNGVEVDIQGVIGHSTNHIDGQNLTLVKAGAGTLKISNTNETPGLRIEEGTVIAAHANALGKDRTLKNTVTVGSTTATATLDLQADNTAAVSILQGNGNGVITNSTETMHTLKVGNAAASASSFAGKITGNLNLNVAANTLTLTGANNDYTGSTTVANGAHLKLTGDGAISASAVDIAVAAGASAADLTNVTLANGAFTKTAAGSDAGISGAALTVTGTLGINLTDIDVTDSVFAVDQGGALTLTGGSLTLAAPIVNKGSMTVSSDIVVNATSDLRAMGAAIYTDTADGGTSGNGYLTQKLGLFTDDSTGTIAFTGTLTVAGEEVTNVASDGSFNIGAQSGEYFINADTVEYSSAADNHAYTGATVLFMNGGNLTLSENLKDGVNVVVRRNGVLTLSGGVTVNSTDIVNESGAIHLEGSGTYNSGAYSATPLENVSFGENWTGTVQVAGGSSNDIDLSAYNIPGSTVEITAGLSSKLSANQYALGTGNLKLSNDITLGGNANNVTYKIDGSLSGSGNIVRTGGGDAFALNLQLNGDASGWSGVVNNQGERTVNITLNGAGDQAVGGGFRMGGTGTMSLTAQSGGTKTVDGNLTIGYSTNASTFNISATGSTSLTFTGGISKTSASKLNITMSSTGKMLFQPTGEGKTVAGVGINEMTVSNGTLEFDGCTDLTVGKIFIGNSDYADGRKLSLVNGSSLGITIANRSGLAISSGANIEVDSTSSFKMSDFAVSGRATGVVAKITATNASGQWLQSDNTDILNIGNAAVTYSGSGATLASKLTNSSVTHTGTGKLTLSGTGSTLDILTIHDNEVELTQSATANRLVGGNTESASTIAPRLTLTGETTVMKVGDIWFAERIFNNLSGTGTLEYTGKDTIRVGVNHELRTINGNLHITQATLEFNDWNKGTGNAKSPDMAIGGKVTADANVEVVSQAELTINASGTLDAGGQLRIGHSTDSDRNWGKLNVSGTLNADGGIEFRGTASQLNVEAGSTVTVGKAGTLTSLTADSGSTATNKGTINLADTAKISITDASVSNIDFATATGKSTIDITAGAAMYNATEAKSYVGKVEGEGTGDLKSLMSDCTLQNTDVVVSAAGATDAAALAMGVENFYNKEFTLNILSGVSVDANSTLELIGMGNYRDIVLHWSVSGEADLSENGASRFISDGNDDASLPQQTYTGGAVNLATLTGVNRGQVVDVWVTYTVPEPTTGALSVLALAALAARRRRKAIDK